MSIFSGRHYTWLSDRLHNIREITPKSQLPGVDALINTLGNELAREGRGFDKEFFLENCGLKKPTFPLAP